MQTMMPSSNVAVSPNANDVGCTHDALFFQRKTKLKDLRKYLQDQNEIIEDQKRCIQQLQDVKRQNEEHQRQRQKECEQRNNLISDIRAKEQEIIRKERVIADLQSTNEYLRRSLEESQDKIDQQEQEHRELLCKVEGLSGRLQKRISGLMAKNDDLVRQNEAIQREAQSAEKQLIAELEDAQRQLEGKQKEVDQMKINAECREKENDLMDDEMERLVQSIRNQSACRDCCNEDIVRVRVENDGQ